jgi:hypothetical protein
VLVAGLYAGPAAAYVDPGSGSLLIQLLLGGLAGLGVMLKLFWHRVVSVVRREPTLSAPPPDA